MYDPGQAGAIATIILFVVFILWAKTDQGQRTLASLFGAPTGAKRKTRARTRSRATAKTTTKPKPKTR